MNRPYSSDSIWNKKIPANAALHPNSEQMIAWLKSRSYTTFGINIDRWTMPVYSADANTPKITIYCSGENSPIDGTFEGPYHTNVPFPANAQPDPSSDHGMIVLDWSTNTEWDFAALELRSDGKWHAGACIPWGPAAQPKPNSGYLPNFVDGSGVMPQEMTAYTWGACATSVPLLAGLIRPEEIAAGVIPHALRFGLCYPQHQRKVYPPAATIDGWLGSSSITEPYAIPEGARLQLDPNLNLDTLGLSPAGKIIAKCMQDYGIILVDSADGLPLYAQNPMGASGWYPADFGSCAALIPLNFRVVNYAVFDAVEELTTGGDVLGYICPYCDVQFATMAELNAHIAESHPPPTPPPVVTSSLVLPALIILVLLFAIMALKGGKK